jgi:hypothetical protein
MASRLDGEKEQKKYLNERYIPGSKGGNPFRPILPKTHKPHKALNSEQRNKNV